MSTTATHRRTLLAMAGATAALASVLAPSAAQASSEVRSPVDGRESLPGVSPGTSAQPTPAAQTPAARAIHTERVTLTQEQAGVRVSCSRTASIDGDRAANRYKVSGSMSCNANGFLRMRCKPVHRHTIGWHSHAWAFDVTQPGRSLNQSSGPINGTNGDTYKANCQYWFNGTSLGTVESGTITL